MADETTKKIDWKKIWTFIKSKIFIALVIAGLIALAAVQCSRIEELKRKRDISDQNIIALNDSIKYHRTKNGEIQAEKAILIADKKTLKDLNEDLFRRFEEQEGKVIDLTHAVIQLRQDSTDLRKYLVEREKVIEKLLKIDDHTYAAPWTLTYKYDSTNFDIFKGRTYIGVLSKDPLELAHVDTEMIERLTQIDLEFGTKVVKGLFNVYIKSAYPGFTVAQLDGVFIDPNTNNDIKDLIKERHWFQGFGVGPQVTMGYNITTGKYGLVLGAGIHYTIYKF
jgi:hypothetical protein